MRMYAKGAAAAAVVMGFVLAAGAGAQVNGEADAARSPHPDGPSVVEVVRTEAGWQLLRNGEPYYVKGAGAKHAFDKLAAAGANSIRTWGANDLEPLLDAAHEAGITVTIGIWLSHDDDHYDDEDAKRAELEEAVGYARRYKDHPALLMWGVGNEMESESGGRNPRVWQHVNDIARAIKAVDPNHPTMTVTAGIGSGRLPNFHRWCPDIDIFGPNIYGQDIAEAVDRIIAFGIDKPIIIPEYGPPGQWGPKYTPWGAPYEPTSTEKARDYLRHYHDPMTSYPGRVLGGYVFYWLYDVYKRDWPTWYSMHHHTGEAYGGVDAMIYHWTGRWPENLAPEVHFLESDADTKYVRPGEVYTARALVLDRDNDPLTVQWIMAGDHETSRGTFFRVPAESYILEQDGAQLRFRIPEDAQPGPHRLHLLVKDGRGKAARGNIAFYVRAEPEPASP